MNTPFEFNVTGSAQGGRCSVCGKWSSTFSWINGIVYCAEHMPQYTLVLVSGVNIDPCAALRADLAACRAQLADATARTERAEAEVALLRAALNVDFSSGTGALGNPPYGATPQGDLK